MESSPEINASGMHDEVEQYKGSAPSENPAATDSFNIVVSVPDVINIRMVDASTLADYEVWMFISSILSSAAIGFIVAYFQAVDAKSSAASYAGYTSLMFVVLFLTTFATALRKRHSLKKKGRDIQLKTSSASAKNGRS